jgi:hypothetical protein
VSHVCDAPPTELTGFDSAGRLMGSAEWRGWKPGYNGLPPTPPRWCIRIGKTVTYRCEQAQAEQEMRLAGAVTIKEGSGLR